MRIVIVGGGIAGLTASYNLLQKGHDTQVWLLERDTRLGGLAKSFRYENAFTFDIGPKRFHTDDPEVMAFLHDVGQKVQLEKIGRSSKVYFLDKYFSWPLQSRDILKLPLCVSARAMKDLLFPRRFSSEGLLIFENYIIAKYGRTLYEIFFKPYTEKFLRSKIETIHSDWASTGINRSIIHKGVKGNSLVELLHRIFLPQDVEANFLYPAERGFGHFWDICAEHVSEHANAVVKKGVTVVKIETRNDCLALGLSDGTRLEADYLLWSGRLPDALRSIGVEDCSQPLLPYLDTIFLDMVFKKEEILSSEAICQWLYVSAGKSCISRISFPSCFNTKNIPASHVGLCVEVTRREEETIDESLLVVDVLRELSAMGLIKSGTASSSFHTHREHATYPIYHSNYKQCVKEAMKMLREFSPRIVPMGRSGSFWYNNADHSIKQALSLTNALLKGQQPIFDCYRHFGGVSDL